MLARGGMLAVTPAVLDIKLQMVRRARSRAIGVQLSPGRAAGKAYLSSPKRAGLIFRVRVQWKKRPANADYVSLADPEGNRFCVVDKG